MTVTAICRANTSNQRKCRGCTAADICGTPEGLLARYDADFITSVNGETTAVSERTCDLLKRPERDSLGRGWRAIVHSADVPMGSFVSAVAARQAWAQDYRVLNGDGRWVWINGVVWPIYDPFGHHIGSAGRVTSL
jgi:PAS domain-containing protein